MAGDAWPSTSTSARVRALRAACCGINAALSVPRIAEIRSQNEVCDANGNVMRATFVVRASMSNGRYSDAYGSCDRGACFCSGIGNLALTLSCAGEKRFMQPNRDVPATAETRASTRAIQNLLGMSE